MVDFNVVIIIPVHVSLYDHFIQHIPDDNWVTLCVYVFEHVYWVGGVYGCVLPVTLMISYQSHTCVILQVSQGTP